MYSADKNVDFTQVLSAFIEIWVPKWTSYITKMCSFPLEKQRNLCYHGTGSEEGAREAARGQQQGSSMPERYNRGDGQ